MLKRRAQELASSRLRRARHSGILSRPLQGPRGGLLLLPDGLPLCCHYMIAESHASTSGGTRNSGIDQFDPGMLERGNQLHERIDVTAHHAVTGFHSLDRGHRKVGQLSHLSLINVQERASSPTACGFAASRRACRPTVGIDPEVDPVDAGLVSTTSFATKGYQLAGSVPIIQSGGDCYPYSLKGNIFSLDLVKDSGYGGYAKPMAS